MKVTEQRTAKDFALCMRDLVDTHYPKADLIRVVLDNLSTHTAGALYETFSAAEAHRVLRRLEFYYTPKDASWLNMVEIEISVLRGQCLDRRIGERDRLIGEIAAWQDQRNASGRASHGSSPPRKRATSSPEPIQTPLLVDLVDLVDIVHNYRTRMTRYLSPSRLNSCPQVFLLRNGISWIAIDTKRGLRQL